MQVEHSELEAFLDTGYAIGVGTTAIESFALAGVARLKRVVASLDERDRACMEAIRPHLGDLYRMTRALDDARAAWGVPSSLKPGAGGLSLTARENEVLQWLGSGKTDKDIGDILGISPRTVHKHLQRIYEKLGVENRTAAVVRARRLEVLR